jgi:HSP20 family protein
MNLIQWKPLSGLNSFFDGDFMNSVSQLHVDLTVDVYEKKDIVTAEMSLPGMSESEIDVFIEDDFLTISGEREEVHDVNEKQYYSKEIKRGSFSRTVRLPRMVVADKAVAEYTDGVLKVKMPVRQGENEKTVKIKVNK